MKMQKTLIISFFCLFFFIGVLPTRSLFAFEQTASRHVVSGLILQYDSGVPLAGATVRLSDSQLGAVTNKLGEFSLNLPRRSHIFIVSMLGHETLIIDIAPEEADTTHFTARLKIKNIRKSEIVVTAETPGERLMRLAIERKQKQSDSLNSYKYTLYTKFTASTDTITAGRKVREVDTTIVSIFETYSYGYFKSPDRYFNEIWQRQQSVNVPPQANFVAFGTNLNAYDDNIEIIGEQIATPFHPDALDLYEFMLDSSFQSDEFPRYGRIIVTPKSKFKKLFRGVINMNSETLTPISLELYPNEPVQLPFDAELSFRQSFSLIDGFYCMPRDMSIYSTLEANIFWLISPRLDINIITQAYDYEINPYLPDSKFSGRRVEILESAQLVDSLFWGQNRKIQLLDIEEEAYKAILMTRDNPDSVMTTTLFEKYIGPVRDQIRKLSRPPFTGWQDIFRYNRVQGPYIGVGMYDYPTKQTFVRGYGGYGFVDESINYKIDVEQYIDSRNRFGFFASAYDYLDRFDDKEIVKNASITLPAFFWRQDYGDYMYNKGFELGIYTGAGQYRYVGSKFYERPVQLRLFYRSEQHALAHKNTNFALLPLPWDFRENPPIVEGNLRSYGFELDYNYNKKRNISNLGFRFSGEFSSKSIFSSDYDFSRLEATTRVVFETLPLWKFDIRLQGGMSYGVLPPQRFFSLESPIANIANINSFNGTKIKEFYGTQYLAAYVEHNFGELIPGVFRIPNIASFGLEFIAFANAGWTDFENADFAGGNKFFHSTSETDDGYYFEAGLGINRALIFFRLDVGYRFTQTPRILLTISGSTFE